MSTLAERFEAYVHRGATEFDCDLWKGPVKTDKNGDPTYGCMWVEGRNRYATSIAWFLEHDDWPDRLEYGEEMCHTCDVKLCVKLTHLWKGNASENAIDAFSKGRRIGMTGVSNPNAKLTDEQAIELIHRFEAGENRQNLADSFGVCLRTLYDITSGRRRGYLAVRAHAERL